MRNFSGRELKALIILSIVIPVGLLATSRLTGILKEAATIAETKTLDTVMWKRERPYTACRIIDPICQVSYRDDEIAFTEILELGHYDPEWFGYKPAIPIGVDNLTVSVANGFVQHIQINFSEKYPISFAFIHYDDGYSVPPNGTHDVLCDLTVDKMLDAEDHLLSNDTKASLNVLRIGEPRYVFMANWSVMYLLRSPYNFTHQIEISSEVIYFNGTAYKRLVQPVQFILGPDNNNSFEDAEKIGFGTHEAYLHVESDVEGDPVDYYKIWLEQGQNVEFALAYPEPLEQPAIGIEMRVYNPEEQIVACLLYQKNGTRRLTINVDMEGWWYVRTDLKIYPCLYYIRVSSLDTIAG